MLIRGDYERAGVPMLPVVAGVRETARQIVLYSWAMVAVSLLFHPVARMGLVYLVSCVVLGRRSCVRRTRWPGGRGAASR